MQSAKILAAKLVVISAPVLLAAAGLKGAEQPSLAERLGYKATDKLLIVNGDDAGMCHTANLATTEALEKGLMRCSTITEREKQILGWVREGMSNHEIGTELGISPLTVKNHVQKILRKLGAANRAQAVARAMTLNLLGRSASEG